MTSSNREAYRATFTISVPKPVEDWLDQQVRTGRYEDAGGVVQDLIQQEPDRQASIARLQERIGEGLKSGISDRSMADIRDEARAISETRRLNGL